MKRFKRISKSDMINMQDKKIRGHVIIKDGETGEILQEKDNLVLMRTRVFCFEHLFKVAPPDYYNCIVDNERSICLFSVGQGGADVNSTAFNPFVPKFSDKNLAQPVPFMMVNKDKGEDLSLDSNPSIVEELTEEQSKKYYLAEENPDGSINYYGKVFEPESKGWVIDINTGEVAYELSMRIEQEECRGFLINEIGLWLAKYDESQNVYINNELATRITFDTESLTSLTKSIEIQYILYI